MTGIGDDKGSDNLNQELMLSIKQVVDDLKQQAHDKSILEEQSSKILKSVQECLGSIKLQIERLKTEQTGFIEARKDRSMNCDRIHTDHEQRLRDMPGGQRCKVNEARTKQIELKLEDKAPLKRLETVEIKVDGFTPLIYKLVGGVTVVALIIPPIVSLLFGFIMKHITDPTQ